MEASSRANKISVHTASALFRQGTELPAMQRGNLEMASPVTFEIEAQLPEYGVFSAAYLFRDADHLIKTFRSDIGREYYDDVASKMGLVILDTAYLGTRTVNLTNDKKIEKPSDLAGTKMRMPPGPAFQVLAKALGTTPVSMPSPRSTWAEDCRSTPRQPHQHDPRLEVLRGTKQVC
jgi:TRAP-type C4-dicarboxylate transport system substrate-binding protein